MRADQVKEADAIARSHFTYKSDIGFDNWRSHADEALANTDWQGDCDDLASTVLDILGRQDCPLQDRYRLVVSTANAKKPDHMVGCVKTEEGWWIVGDTFGTAISAPLMQHRGIFYNRLSEAYPDAIWREGVPWKSKEE